MRLIDADGSMRRIDCRTSKTVSLLRLSEFWWRIEALLAALSAGSSSPASAACDLAHCLLWGEIVRHGTGPTSSGSVRTDPA